MSKPDTLKRVEPLVGDVTNSTEARGASETADVEMAIEKPSPINIFVPFLEPGPTSSLLNPETIFPRDERVPESVKARSIDYDNIDVGLIMEWSAKCFRIHAESSLRATDDGDCVTLDSERGREVVQQKLIVSWLSAKDVRFASKNVFVDEVLCRGREDQLAKFVGGDRHQPSMLAEV